MISGTNQGRSLAPIPYSRGRAFRIYANTIGVAFLSLARGQWKNGFKLLAYPVGYWRFVPNALVWNIAASLGKAPLRILDVSSPKVISLELGKLHHVTAIDLDDPQLETRWKKTAELLGLRNYKTQFANACQLPFESNSFDFAYSLSVIEHIPDTGDTQAVREIARVVRPGGLILVEVPLRYKDETLMLHYDSKGFPLASPRFYERRYSPESVAARLIIPELQLRDQWAMGETLAIDPWIATPRLPRFLRLVIAPFESLLAAWNMWLEPPSSRRPGPLSAILLFQKPDR